MGWIAIVPPVLSIVLAIWKKDVILALSLGIFSGELLLHLFGQNGAGAATPSFLSWVEAIFYGFIQTLERCVFVFQDQGNTRVLLFGLIVGVLIEWMRASGGVSAFVLRLTGMGLTRSARRVAMLPALIGVLVFVETSMSALASGLVSQRLFDQFKLSRAQLAFIVDSTCSPVSVLILFNGWGAFLLQQVSAYDTKPIEILSGSIPYNFYPILILVFVIYTAVTGKVFGPMKRAESRSKELETSEQWPEPTRSRYMVVPLVVLIGAMFFFMWFTGKGDLMAGSGSRSVLWSVTLATLTAFLLLRGRFDGSTKLKLAYQGMSALLPVVLIMLLSFAIGETCKSLGTGTFIAGAIGEDLPVALLAPLIFTAASLMSFTTGTSWGTFAVMIPIGMPLAAAMQLDPSFILAAILGGGVFGDHCSPISDTTIISSLASGCDHLEHVRTQLPYALVAASLSILLYLGVGLVLY